MRRARTLLNLPIVSLADGLRIGQVKDIVFDCKGKRIAALIVAEAGWWHETRLVPLDQVHGLGRSAVTVQNRQAIVVASATRPIRRLIYNGVLLTGLHVLTEGGSDLGTVDDVFVAPDGAIIGYEISAGVVRDVMAGKRFIAAADILNAGPDCAIVPDHVETVILEQPADIIERMLAAQQPTIAIAAKQQPEATPAAGEEAISATAS